MLYPIGIQNLENIRQSGYVYVDKTDLVHRLVTTGKYYFLSRPRRFGKSLLVSTLEAYFQGKKESFSGLAIGNLEKDRNSYPILHLDLSGKTYSKAEDLEMTLDQHLSQWEKIALEKGAGFVAGFWRFSKKMYLCPLCWASCHESHGRKPSIVWHRKQKHLK